jgi:hypothetical protein
VQKITVSLTIPEVNQILEALGTMPYAQVYELIANLHQQAEGQVGLSAVAEEKLG